MPEDKKKHNYRWLHISDLHIMANANSENFLNYILKGNNDSYDEFEKRGLEGILQDRGGVDCVVITGDFFDKGSYSTTNKENVEKVLNNLYGSCAFVSQWNWTEGQLMDRLCFCAGNHDLKRNTRYHDEETDKDFERQDIIARQSAESPAHLTARGQERELIVKNSFEKFYEQITVLRGKDKMTSYCDGQLVSFCPDAIDSQFPMTVQFIGMNTALLAGQLEKENTGIAQYEAWQMVQTAAMKGNYKEAKEHFESWIEQQMVATGRINDYPKMCLPEKEAFDCLIHDLRNLRISTTKPVVPILFGHHSFEYLNESAKNRITYYLRDQGIHAYLCGHAHQVGDRVINIPYSRSPAGDCLEVTVGGLFWDNEKFNQISFSIGTIECEDGSPNYKITIEYFACVMSSAKSNAGIWMTGISKWPKEGRSFNANLNGEGDTYYEEQTTVEGAPKNVEISAGEPGGLDLHAVSPRVLILRDFFDKKNNQRTIPDPNDQNK